MLVYILKSLLTDKTYVGITTNLDRRLKEHNQGRNTYTKRYKPWKIVYTENVDNLIQGRKKEKYYKSSSGRKWMKNNLFK